MCPWFVAETLARETTHKPIIIQCMLYHVQMQVYVHTSRYTSKHKTHLLLHLGICSHAISAFSEGRVECLVASNELRCKVVGRHYSDGSPKFSFSSIKLEVVSLILKRLKLIITCRFNNHARSNRHANLISLYMYLQLLHSFHKGL